jgi:hypothetical protein
MKIKLTLFIVTFLFIQTLSIKAQDNLVTNGSFETVDGSGKPTGWEYESSGTTWSTTTVDGIEGKVLNVNKTGGGMSGMYQIIESGISSQKEYRFVFQYNIYNEPGSAANNPTYIILWMDETGEFMNAYMVEQTFSASTDGWTAGRKAVTSPEGAVAVGIQFSFPAAIGIYIDDVQFYEYSSGITNIKSIQLQELSVRSENGNLVVSGAPAGSRIDVYNIFGERLQSVIAATGETVLSGLPKGQVLIVRSGNKVAKVVVK